MVSSVKAGEDQASTLSVTGRRQLLHSLVPIAISSIQLQLEEFTAKLSAQLMAMSDQSSDPKEANRSFNASNLLRKNGASFHFLIASCLEKLLREEVQIAERLSPAVTEKRDEILTLVPYAEMDNKVLVGNISRPFELTNNDQLTALGIRLASLFQRAEMAISQNPFRPDLFITSINLAWSDFCPDAESHYLVLPLLKPEIFLDLAPVYHALNGSLIARGVLPDLVDAYRIKKSNEATKSTAKSKPKETQLAQQLARLFSPDDNSSQVPDAALATSFQESLQHQFIQAAAVSNQLLGYLAGMQKNMFDHRQTELSSNESPDAAVLKNIKDQAPQGALSRVDEKTIDLLTHIFNVVFSEQNIPVEFKSLIGLLQVPVLKAALLDKDFFYKEEHPARRLIEVLTKSSMGWDQTKGQDDPLYQVMKRNVERVQQEYDQQISVFSDVVTDLESFIQNDEAATTGALQAPITKALRQEKLGQAKKIATVEVSHRIGTGEVVTFVESFLEDKWVPVLTIAYTMQEEKPEAVKSAISTMDDLVWSVKPKITMEQRRELIAKLPAMLASLNKWLTLVKWEDADRLQFFAELAECHASIVRAPIEMSPQRQLEIALEVAKKAAERRLEMRAKEEPEPLPDEYVDQVAELERGMWLEFTEKAGEAKRVKLAWISPMRSLFIFASKDKQESFSLSEEVLAKSFREQRVRVLIIGDLVDLALNQTFDNSCVNDHQMNGKAAA